MRLRAGNAMLVSLRILIISPFPVPLFGLPFHVLGNSLLLAIVSSRSIAGFEGHHVFLPLSKHSEYFRFRQKGGV